MEKMQIICFVFSIVLQARLCLSDDTIKFSIQEERPVRSVVGSLQDKLRDSNSFSSNTAVKYKILNKERSPAAALFSITENSGILLTAKLIDRESICEFDRECVQQFDVAVTSATDSSYFDIFTVEITIEDINDNSPKFPSESSSLVLSEGTMLSALFPIPVAIDKDMGGFSVVRYEIEPSHGSFALQQHKTFDGAIQVNLKLNKHLDRETEEFFDILITAYDGGEPAKEDKLLINVSVTDMNDNSPKFEKQVYNVTIDENVKINTPVILLKAHDKDTGKNGEIHYKLSTHQSDKVLDMFSLNETSGQLYITNQLLYYTREGLKIVVDAIDQGLPPLTAQAVVMVSILDTTNNPPIISINPLFSGNDAFIHIPENKEVGTVIAHITVEDSDTGPNGIVSCEILGETFVLQPAKRKGYTVVLNSQLDRETTGNINETIICQDMGTNAVKISKTLVVYIDDENDNIPTFLQDIYFSFVPENTEKGYLVTKVLAVDEDQGKNGEVVYKIHDSEKHRFDISSKGQIITKVSFDREDESDVVVRVLASDKGKHSITSTATVMITIYDENDHTPKFTDTSFTFDIQENQPKFSKAGQLIARDPDSGDNGKIVYIILDDDIREIFQILENGILETLTILDHEQQDKFEFIVEASDKGSLPRSAFVNVTVVVTDVNDNKPNITFPDDKINNTIVIPQPKEQHQYITTVQAYDLDSDLNGKLWFSITDGNKNNIFTIRPEKGIIQIKNLPRITRDTSYKLRITVQDLGMPAQSSNTTLNINITYNPDTYIALFHKETSSDSNYALVAIIVVVVTCAVAAGILVAICVVRRIDNHRGLQSGKAYYQGDEDLNFKTDKNDNSKALQRKKSDSEKSIRSTDSFISGVDKKPLDTTNDSSNGSNYKEFRNSPVFKHVDASKQETSDNSRFQPFQKPIGFPNTILDGSVQSLPNHKPSRLPFSGLDDGCGEITCSDSGKGLSEEDSRSSDENWPVHAPPAMKRTNSCDNYNIKTHKPSEHSQKRMVTFGVPREKYNNSWTNSLSDRYNNPVLQRPQRPQNNLSYNGQEKYGNYLTNYPRDPYRLLPTNRSVSFGTVPSANPQYSPVNQTAVENSLNTLGNIQDDDDDDRTTTSGSYTVNLEDLDESLVS